MKAQGFLFIFIIILLSMCKSNPDAGKANSGLMKSIVKPEERISGSISLPATVRSLKDDAEMILIQRGTFIYGINAQRRDSIIKSLSEAYSPVFREELPEKTIYLPSYYIDKYEVTNRQFEKFLKETGYKRKPRYYSNRLYNDPDQPVVGILYQDAEAYAAWAGKRVPKEEEWEKAARGPNGNIWPWGNDPSGDKYNGHSSGNYTPVKVGSFPEGESFYHVMDMAGNVYEYTSAIWMDTVRVMRGGSYLNTGPYSMTTFRWGSAEPGGAEYLGFRCVMDTTQIIRQVLEIK
jgi:formylglycine-generating enzyme required for sulfatase activity